MSGAPETLQQKFRQVRRRQQELETQGDTSSNRFTWGKHKHDSFADVYDNDPSYVAWSVDHLKKPTQEQQGWVAYIEMRLQQEEKALEEQEAQSSHHKPTAPPLSELPVAHSLDSESRLLSLEQRVAALERQMMALWSS